MGSPLGWQGKPCFAVALRSSFVALLAFALVAWNVPRGTIASVQVYTCNGCKVVFGVAFSVVYPWIRLAKAISTVPEVACAQVVAGRSKIVQLCSVLFTWDEVLCLASDRSNGSAVL